MGTKGEASKEKILECARRLFAQKGYSSVTMQDICVSSGFSRGGLYRHFQSTEAIFAAIINKEQSDAIAALENAESRGVSPVDMIRVFLLSRMEHISQGGGFESAISDFAANSAAGRDILIRRAENSIKILTAMIRLGCEKGEISCSRAEETAKHMLWLIEGMIRHAGLMDIAKEDISVQLDMLMELLNEQPDK